MQCLYTCLNPHPIDDQQKDLSCIAQWLHNDGAGLKCDISCGPESFAFGTILNCKSTEEQEKHAGSSWLRLCLEVTHGPEMFAGVERRDGEQHDHVLCLHRPLNVVPLLSQILSLDTDVCFLV